MPILSSGEDGGQPDRRTMLSSLARFQVPSLRRSVMQLMTTVAPYAALTVLMYYAYYHISPWLTLALALPAAGLVVRLFIIQHDCGHGAFFPVALGKRGRRPAVQPDDIHALRAMAPAPRGAPCRLEQSRQAPERRRHLFGMPYAGRIRGLSPLRQRLYRAALHPLVSQLLLPPVVFVLLYRVPFDTPRGWRKERVTVYLTNLGIGAL